MRRLLFVLILAATTVAASAESYRMSDAKLPDGTLSGVIIRESDGLAIPPDPKNSDYQAYLASVAAGNPPAKPAPKQGD